MFICQPRGDPTSRRPLKEAQLQQEGLIHVHDSVCVLTNGCSYGLQSHGPAIELLHDGTQHLVVDLIQTEVVHFQSSKGFQRDVFGDCAALQHLSVVTHSTEQPVGDPRCATGTSRDLRQPLSISLYVQNLG